MGTIFTYIRRLLVNLNLFKSGLNDDEVVREERWSTRLYLILLMIGLVILLIYTALGTQTVYVIVEKPSFDKYQTLQKQYPETLKCPCTQIAVKYGRFLQIQPVYHQICSSKFVSQDWIETVYGGNVSNIWPMDVRTVLSAHAQFLRTFCDNTQLGIAFVLIDILSSSLVSSEVLPSSLVEIQVRIQEEAVRSAGKWQLSVVTSFVGLTMSSSHMMSGLGMNSFLYIPSNDSSEANAGINSYQLNSNSVPCYCLTIDNCPVPGAIYPTNQMPTFGSFNLETFGVGSIPIKGMKLGCFALDSVLSSTLECYYDSNCVGLLNSNSTLFPPLSLTPPSNFPMNTTIDTLVNELLVEDLLVNMSFASYYSECAPKTCSYSYNQRNNFLVIFTTITALVGGLNSILRLLVPLFIRMIMQIKRRIQSQNNSNQRVPTVWIEQTSKLDKIKNKFTWLWMKIRTLNLFDSNSSNTSTQKHERQTTRLYIIFVTIAFVILLCYTVLTEETKVYTVEKPSQETYENLYSEYSSTIECSCEKIAIDYSTFITIEANYHQACSSLFISPTFFSQLAMIRRDAPIYPADFILMGVDYFQWLTTFCTLSQLVFDNQLKAFKSQLFVNNKLLAHDSFDIQSSQLVDFFISDVQFYFARGVKNMRELIGFSQLLSATSAITYQLPIIKTSAGNQVRIEPANIFSSCSCVSDPTSCSDDAIFYTYNSMNGSFYPAFTVTGVRTACSPMESLLQSTLDCWYSSDCYQTVIDYWQNRTYYLTGLPPLLNSTIPSQYTPSTPLHLIIDKLMVENWSKQISYNLYYSQCAPLYCTYSVTQRRDVIFVITVLLGLFGGLNIILRLLTPLVIKLTSWFITHGRNCSISFRRNFREIPTRIRRLNLFYHRHQSSESTLTNEIYSTRFYIFLLLITMLILLFYYSLSESLTTIIIENPTEDIYGNLHTNDHISSLQCACTHVSIPYEKFVQVNTSLHDICSSKFIEESWVRSIYGNGDWSNISSNEFSSRSVVYFQGLSSLCYLYQENNTHYVSHFLSSSLISSQVISQTELINQVNDTIEQVKASSRADYHSMYKFARDLEGNSQLMTVYSTNWIYQPIIYDPTLIGLPVPLEPVYHGNCSCATSSKCIEPVRRSGQSLPGFVLGCLPIESLFLSTLICLYNQTCIDKINLKNLTVKPLIPPSNNQLSIKRTVEQLVANGFDLEWSFNISYSKFFDQCQPSSCSYSMNQRKDIVQILIILLGLYGGLTVALRFIVPHVIDFIHRIIRRCTHSSNNIQPINEQKY